MILAYLRSLFTKGPYIFTFNPEMCENKRHATLWVMEPGCVWPTPVGVLVNKPIALLALKENFKTELVYQATICGYSPMVLEVDGRRLITLGTPGSVSRTLKKKINDPSSRLYERDGKQNNLEHA